MDCLGHLDLLHPITFLGEHIVSFQEIKTKYLLQASLT